MTTPRTSLAESADAGSRSVLVLDISPASPLAAARLETLRIHLTDLSATLIVERVDTPKATTSARVDLAVALGRKHAAAAVLFVEEVGDVELRVYWVEPRQGRTWMRRLPIGSDDPSATSEKAALIASAGVQELLEVGRLAMQPVETSAEPSKPPVPARPRERERLQRTPPTPRASLQVSYQGSSFAQEAPWQSGVGLQLAARVGRGVFVAAKFSFLAPVDIVTGGLAAHLVRRPAELAVGYRSPAPLALRAELGTFADYVLRSTTQAAAGHQPTADSGRVFLGASARLGLDWKFLPRLRLVGLFGADVLFNKFDYLSDSSTAPVAIHVRRLRPALSVGIVAELW